MFGVRGDLIVDIDESGVHMYDANRTYGHAPAGKRIELKAFSKNPGIRYNVLAAISPIEGVVAHLVYEGNSIDSCFTCLCLLTLFICSIGTTNRDTILCFLQFVLFPQLRGTRRVIMWDNAAFHSSPEIHQAFREEGHLLVRRPPYSPDFAPIESLFSQMKAYLKRISHSVTENNISTKISEALRQTTHLDVIGWFTNCHYFIPGYPYKPFEGD